MALISEYSDCLDQFLIQFGPDAPKKSFFVTIYLSTSPFHSPEEVLSQDKDTRASNEFMFSANKPVVKCTGSNIALRSSAGLYKFVCTLKSLKNSIPFLQ